MPTNRDLLKEAIADAKTVKETAIANAKAALEEAFTPHLKSMLSAKLEEMDRDEDGELEEMDAYSFKEKNGDSIDAAPRKVGQTTVQEEEEVEEEFNLDELLAELGEDKESETMNEELTEEEDEQEAEDLDVDAEGESDDEIDLEDMTEEDLKSFIEDVIKDMVEAGELEAGEEMEDGADMEDMEAEDEIEIEGDDEAEEIMENEEVEEYGNPRMQTRADQAAGGLENIHNALKALIKMGGEAGVKAGEILKSMAQGVHSSKMEEEVEEANEMDDIEELKKELHEVNLLNAKLLYTNKIFKAKNLSEDKKVKVLKAFDKAETVKEAKVIYETLNEGLSSSMSRPISMVNEIKSSASKSSGFIPTVKSPIVENDAFYRMQRLAGIIKEN